MPRTRPEPRWLTRLVVDAVHTDQVKEHGGMPGLRDENGLEAALARPRNKWLYERRADIAELAAAYGFGLARAATRAATPARNHPYYDGNKRTALVAMVAFLGINGYDVEAGDEDVLTTVLALAAGRLSEEQLADWLRMRVIAAP